MIQNLQAILDSVGDAILVMDSKGVFVYANLACISMLQINKSEEFISQLKLQDLVQYYDILTSMELL